MLQSEFEMIVSDIHVLYTLLHSIEHVVNIMIPKFNGTCTLGMSCVEDPLYIVVLTIKPWSVEAFWLSI